MLTHGELQSLSRMVLAATQDADRRTTLPIVQMSQLRLPQDMYGSCPIGGAEIHT